MTATIPPVNDISGEEDVAVETNYTVFPLCPLVSASTEADDGDGSDEEDGDGETLTNGKESKKR